MGFVFDLKGFFFLVFVCAFHFGPSTAQTNRRDSLGAGNEDYRQGSYFFYQTPDYPRDCQEVRDQCSSSVSSGVYLIKPDGYPKPFEVYCNNNVDSVGWTVIQRRLDGSINFHRNWEEYKIGFGFLSSEFWVGNERLSFLTNQNVYELRVDILLSDDTSFHIKYDKFRISDEWGKFSLSVGENFTGNAVYTPCPQNTVYGNCTCVGTCEDPLGTSGCPAKCNDQAEACVCQEGFLMKGEQCVSPSECGCYVSEQNRILQDGETSYNPTCTEKCSCNNGLLSCENVSCSPDATCEVQDGVRQCYCNDGYSGDGETCTRDVFRDCNDVRDAGNTQDGVYSILPTGWTGSAFNVFCNMTIDGGGWIVFQRRNRGATDFYRNWSSYKNGFGDIQDEFWLGNDKLHVLTQQGTYELRVDFVTASISAKYAKYSSFRIDSESTKYRVTSISGYSGNGYDAMWDISGERFSTFDQDNDGYSDVDCAEGHRGGWWYWNFRGTCVFRTCFTWRDASLNRRCSTSNPNGDYNGVSGKNIYWYDYNGGNCINSLVHCSVKYTEMKVRRSS